MKKTLKKILKRKNYKEPINEVMELLVIFLKKSFSGEQIRKYIEKENACKSELWLLTEYDERVKVFMSVRNGYCIVKLAQDEGEEDKNNKANVEFLHLGAFVLSIIRGIMKKFVEAIGG